MCSLNFYLCWCVCLISKSAVIVENVDNLGVNIGRVRKYSSDDEACMYDILNAAIKIESCMITCTEAAESDKSIKSLLNGCLIFVDIVCASDSELNFVTTCTTKYDVTVDILN